MDAKNWLHDFTKSQKDHWIGGVCGGLGEHTPVPSWTWRLIFVLLVLVWGTGLLLYILLWIFVPGKPKNGDSRPSA
ncbi:MAG: PspC domain protein [Smithella sp. PtaU1.Bin162]|nr:MAG: PspC domain protein [Smithella sp. PtaU1.Bin162]